MRKRNSANLMAFFCFSGRENCNRLNSGCENDITQNTQLCSLIYPSPDRICELLVILGKLCLIMRKTFFVFRESGKINYKGKLRALSLF